MLFRSFQGVQPDIMKIYTAMWERTGLVARTVFKIAEVAARRLVGSIPTRSRQVNTLAPPSDFRLILPGFARRRSLSLHLSLHRIAVATRSKSVMQERLTLGNVYVTLW